MSDKLKMEDEDNYFDEADEFISQFPPDFLAAINEKLAKADIFGIHEITPSTGKIFKFKKSDVNVSSLCNEEVVE